MIFFFFIETSIIQKYGADFNDKDHSCDSWQPVANDNSTECPSNSPQVMPQCQDWCLIFTCNMVFLHKVVIGHVTRCYKICIHKLFINCNHAKLVFEPNKWEGICALRVSKYIRYIHNYYWVVNITSKRWQPIAKFLFFLFIWHFRTFFSKNLWKCKVNGRKEHYWWNIDQCIVCSIIYVYKYWTRLVVQWKHFYNFIFFHKHLLLHFWNAILIIIKNKKY